MEISAFFILQIKVQGPIDLMLVCLSDITCTLMSSMLEQVTPRKQPSKRGGLLHTEVNREGYSSRRRKLSYHPRCQSVVTIYALLLLSGAEMLVLSSGHALNLSLPDWA